MGSLALPERISLLSLGKRLKIFPFLYRYVKEAYPNDPLSDFDSLYYRHRVLVDDQLKMLHLFADKCTNEKMRFVAYKGIALSQLVYGEAEARQLGDIDILVDKHDISRCHYCLSEIGFRQITHRLKRRASSIDRERFLAFRYGESSPYPFRCAAHDNQLAPYFHTETPIRLEVHDSIRGADERLSRLLLWRVSEIGDCVRTFDLEASLISIILNAYSNSETFYAKIDEESNLRDYVDFHTLLKKNENVVNWSYLHEIIEEFNLKDACAKVCSNYRQIYGSAGLEGIEDNFGLTHYSKVPPCAPFLKRLRNPGDEHVRVLQEIKALYANAISCGRALDLDCDYLWSEYSNPYGLEIRFRIIRKDNNLVFSWLLPVEVIKESGFFYLQWFLVPCYDAPFFEYSIGLSLEGEEDICATLRSLDRLGKYPKRGRYLSDLEVKSRSVEGECVVKSITLPFDLIGASRKRLNCGIASFPVVFMKMAGSNYYHSIRAQEGEFTENPIVSFAKGGYGNDEGD